MALFPNVERLERGMFVRNVHPCDAGRSPDGVVEMVSGIRDEGDTVDVRVGSGSTVYGPAENWAPIEAKPDWLVRLEERRCYCPDDCNCHQAHRPNYCGCRGHDRDKREV